jgi:hypothetical protein
MRLFLFLTLSWCICDAQSVSFGVIGGGRPLETVSSPASDESKGYTIGPMVDIGLPFGLGFEVDALYSRGGYTAFNASVLSSETLRQRTNSWEFPLLVKHTMPFPIVKPFLEVGYAPRHISGSLDTSGSFLSSPSGQMTTFNTHNSVGFTSHGLVLGGGVKIGAGPLHVSPQIRYTRWNNSPFGFNFPDGPSFSASQNQIDLLIGVGWKVR